MRFEAVTTLPATPQDAYAWHARPGALERLIPPFDAAEVEAKRGAFEDQEVTLRMRAGPIRTRWVARHVEAVPGVRFVDEGVRGPFRSWRHEHRFEAHPDGCRLTDAITFEPPLGRLGQILAGRALRRRMERMFAWRHTRTRQDLKHHAAHARAMRVAVTGASGLIGKQFTALLTTGGHEVLRIVRSPAGEVRWDPEGGVGPGLEGVDAVVHLAGEPIAQRWTTKAKRRIHESRRQGTRTLASHLAGLDRPPRVLLSMSAEGYYGDQGDTVLTEDMGPGDGFLAEVCRDWEHAADPARDAGIRVVHPRLGLVMSAEGGALPPMLPPFRMGLGGPIADGRHWWTWIAFDDTVRALHHLIDRDVAGPVNVAGPDPVRVKDFVKTLGKVLRRPAVLPLPGFAVKALFGEMGKEILLTGHRLDTTRLAGTGFEWGFTDLEAALRHELGRPA